MRNRIYLFSLIVLATISRLSAGAQDSLFTIRSNNMSITLNSNAGARVISFKVDENELLGSYDIHQQYYGSTLWLSPQGKWKGNQVLDRAPYSVKKRNRKSFRFKSQRDSVHGFLMEKKVRTGTDTSFIITYTIKNIASDTQWVAPWEVTRVPTGGLAFFLKGPEAPLVKSNLKIVDIGESIWYPYDSVKAGAQKMFSSGSEGWIAYIKDGYIFIKKFPVVTSDKVAPREENVEIYVNPDRTYVELENQGPYQVLKANGSLTYVVKWYARRLPSKMDTSLGSKDLVKYVRSIVLK